MFEDWNQISIWLRRSCEGTDNAYSVRCFDYIKSCIVHICSMIHVLRVYRIWFRGRFLAPSICKSWFVLTKFGSMCELKDIWAASMTIGIYNTLYYTINHADMVVWLLRCGHILNLSDEMKMKCARHK